MTALPQLCFGLLGAGPLWHRGPLQAVATGRAHTHVSIGFAVTLAGLGMLCSRALHAASTHLVAALL